MKIKSADQKSNTAQQLHTCVVSADFAFALRSLGTLKVEKLVKAEEYNKTKTSQRKAVSGFSRP